MKFAKKILGMLLLFGAVMPLTACDNTTYVAHSEFFYSSDAGKTYGNRTKEFEVGKTVYMQLIVLIESDGDKPETMDITLTIPKITAVDAKYYDGQTITPIPDEIANTTKYPFTVVAAKEPMEWPFVFQFIPNSPGEITMTLEYSNENLNIYNKQNTVKFVEPDNSSEA